MENLNQTDRFGFSITIDEQIIPWQEVFAQLQLFGKLRPFVQEIVSQRLIVREIQARAELPVQTSELEQAVIDFRLRHQLTDRDKFEKWLSQEGIDYPAFQNRVIFSLKVNKLKTRVAEPNLSTAFENSKPSLEQIELSYLALSDRELADQLAAQLRSGENSFEEISKDYEAVPDSIVKCTTQVVRRGWLVKEIKEALKTCRPGELVGPLAIENRWGILRIEKILPVVMDERLKRQLEEKLFRQWLAEKMNAHTVRLKSSLEALSDLPSSADLLDSSAEEISSNGRVQEREYAQLLASGEPI
ncbi:peptidylprolyl isomerase [Altericista sp. CCNU0014]|uniref:peptidylprolyl isomerase n=1 Tax=Altericista sp. CCNU0014 TaxID=3082949 RepID=UPI00384C24AD